jgi:hypothetical protein
MSPLSQLIACIIFAGVGLAMFFGGEFRALGLPLGTVGVWIFIAAVWFFVDALHRIPRTEAELAIAPGEWQSWVGVAFTTAVLIAILQKTHVFNVAVPIYENIDAGRSGRNIGMLFVAWLVLAKTEVQFDERDRQIEHRASSWGRGASTAAIIAVALLLGFSPTARLQLFSYPLIGQMLLFALLVGAWVDQASAAWLYLGDRRALGST